MSPSVYLCLLSVSLLLTQPPSPSLSRPQGSLCLPRGERSSGWGPGQHTPLFDLPHAGCYLQIAYSHTHILTCALTESSPLQPQRQVHISQFLPPSLFLFDAFCSNAGRQLSAIHCCFPKCCFCKLIKKIQTDLH